jgi:hypothetical protein
LVFLGNYLYINLIEFNYVVRWNIIDNTNTGNKLG